MKKSFLFKKNVDVLKITTSLIYSIVVVFLFDTYAIKNNLDITTFLFGIKVSTLMAFLALWVFVKEFIKYGEIDES